MTTPRAADMRQTLSLAELPPNGTGWHELLQAGLPFKSLRAVARSLKMKEADLAAELGLNARVLAARKKAKRLAPAESDLLHAIAGAYVTLANIKGTDEAAAWLKAPAEVLKGQVPLEFLKTRIGTGYVTTAIERMRPPLRLELPREEQQESADDEAEED